MLYTRFGGTRYRRDRLRPHATRLRIVYNYGTEPGGGKLICANTDALKMARVTLVLLVLAALAAMFIGCAAGSGDSSQPSAERQAPETGNPSKAEPTNQKVEDTDPSGQAATKRPGHPALGSADAPVVLTEYGDYQ